MHPDTARSDRVNRFPLSDLRCNPFQRERVGLAAEIFFQRSQKKFVVIRRLREESHRGSELEIVWRTEDLVDAAAFSVIDDRGAFAETRSEDRVLHIGFGFAQGADGVALRGRAVAEASDLRKDEPDPVAAFSARTQLAEHLLIDSGLGFEEALQVVWVDK